MLAVSARLALLVRQAEDGRAAAAAEHAAAGFGSTPASPHPPNDRPPPWHRALTRSGGLPGPLPGGAPQTRLAEVWLPLALLPAADLCTVAMVWHDSNSGQQLLTPTALGLMHHVCVLNNPMQGAAGPVASSGCLQRGPHLGRPGRLGCCLCCGCLRRGWLSRLGPSSRPRRTPSSPTPSPHSVRDTARAFNTCRAVLSSLSLPSS